MEAPEILRQQVAEVAARRADRDEVAATVKALREQFEASIAHHTARLKTLNDAVASSEASARAIAVALYHTTGEKKPTEGVQIKVTTKLVYDPAEAFAKAKAMGVAIVPEALDVKAFEKIAKASRDSFPFVEVVEEPTATLGSDLSSLVREVAA